LLPLVTGSNRLEVDYACMQALAVDGQTWSWPDLP
jgi:hypothetical protein